MIQFQGDYMVLFVKVEAHASRLTDFTGCLQVENNRQAYLIFLRSGGKSKRRLNFLKINLKTFFKNSGG